MIVQLKCVAEGRRLRVKIISPGYFSDANCQFPRNLRLDGRIYQVDSSSISLVYAASGKYFYRVSGAIEIVSSTDIPVTPTDAIGQVSVERIFDSGEPECVVCLEEPKTLVMVPCGHYCLCAGCKSQMSTACGVVNGGFKCPLCRNPVTLAVQTDQIR